MQLDVLAKYAGVTRNFQYQNIVFSLSDDELRKLIQFAVISNTSNGTLYSIVYNLNLFFPDLIFCFDHSNMHMNYYTSTQLGSSGLLVALLYQGILPKPMGVQLGTTIYAPVINLFFGFRTYLIGMYNATPFNTYLSVNPSWIWLSYNDALELSAGLLNEVGESVTQEDGSFIFLD
jgi:hypothetical protein